MQPEKDTGHAQYVHLNGSGMPISDFQIQTKDWFLAWLI